MFANLNAGDPTKWTYVADPNAAGRGRPQSFRTTSLRLTVAGDAAQQVQPLLGRADAVRRRRVAGRDRASAAASPGDNEIIAGGTAAPTPSASATAAPETGAYRDVRQRVRQATWKSPVTNRLLLEAGVGTYASRYGGDADAGQARRATSSASPSSAPPAARTTAASRT